MLKLIVSEDVPKPVEARNHVANQEPATISSQAGLSTLRRGAAIARGLFSTIDETHPNALSRLDRLDGVGGDAA